MTYAIVDDNGIVVNVVVSNRQLDANWIAIPTGCPAGIGDSYLNGCFYDPDGVMRNTPEMAAAVARVTELEDEKVLLTAQIQALSDRGEFLEDCIAEMAMLVYA